MVKDISREAIDRAEINGATPEKTVVNMLSAMFSPQELARGIVTKPRKDGINQLNPTKIRAIRGMVLCILNIKVRGTCTSTDFTMWSLLGISH